MTCSHYLFPGSVDEDLEEESMEGVDDEIAKAEDHFNARDNAFNPL